MKTAVLIFGEFREFEIAQKSWTFLNKIDYDLYISTWNYSYEENELLGIHLREDVTPDRILKYFPNATINIEDEFYSISPTKMTYHWRKLFNMVTISGKEYNNILLMRPDIVLYNKNDEDFINLINSKIEGPIIYNLSGIVHSPSPVFLYVQDCLFLGEAKMMKNALLSFPPPDISYKDIHYHLSKHFINNDIYIESIFPNIISNYYIMRSIQRKFIDLDLNFDLQKLISEDWFLLKHRNDYPSNIIEVLKKYDKITTEQIKKIELLKNKKLL